MNQKATARRPQLEGRWKWGLGIAAAALMVCNKADNLKEGAEMAALAIDDGGAKAVLGNLVATTQKLAD